MEVRWSPEAAADFASVVEYIRMQNPSAAKRVASTIYSGVSGLKNFPLRGRMGRIENTRELVFAPLPYVVVYRVLETAVEISRVLHGAQRWP